MRNRFTCNNGLIFSLQTSESHYCSPPTNAGPWTHVEIGFPNRKIDALMPYADGAWRDCPPTDDVYAYVPMEVVQEVNDMNTQDIVREMVNDPMITITEDMIPIINDPSILMDMAGNLIENQFSRDNLLRTKPKKRKVSKYQKELGRQLKLLKKKHPRTAVTKLMRKAHAATRKALK